MHLCVKGKRNKIRFIPVHQTAQRLIAEYLEAFKLGRRQEALDLDGPLFRPVKNNRTGTLDRHLDPGSVYRNIVVKYGAKRASMRK